MINENLFVILFSTQFCYLESFFCVQFNYASEHTYESQDFTCLILSINLCRFEKKLRTIDLLYYL